MSRNKEKSKMVPTMCHNIMFIVWNLCRFVTKKIVYFVLILYLYQAKLNIDRDTSGISHKGCLNSVHNQLATLPSIFLLLYGVDFGASV